MVGRPLSTLSQFFRSLFFQFWQNILKGWFHGCFLYNYATAVSRRGVRKWNLLGALSTWLLSLTLYSVGVGGGALYGVRPPVVFCPILKKFQATFT